MKILLANAFVLYQDQLKQQDVLVCDGLVAKIAKTISPFEANTHIDCTSLSLLPGFFDIHTHGALGIDFNCADADQVNQVSSFFLKKGVTSYLPTILTDTTQVMCRQLERLSNPALLKENPSIKGIHLEGPFLNVAYKGAMPAHLLKDPDIGLLHELYAASRNTIKLLTIAPELPCALKVIEEATRLGIRVSLGHSCASYIETVSALRAGAVSTTHIMNAMKLLHMHDPAILTAVLEHDCYAEMICDGFHLHPPIVRLLLKTKGYERMIAVTDSISAAGCPDGLYTLGVNAVEVKNGDANLSSSRQHLDDGQGSEKSHFLYQ